MQGTVFGLLCESVAVQVMVVTPTGYGTESALPSLRVPVAENVPSQLSLAVAEGVGLKVAAHFPGSLGMFVRSAGQVIVGFSWSLTVTFWVQVAVLPEVSVTFQ